MQHVHTGNWEICWTRRPGARRPPRPHYFRPRYLAGSLQLCTWHLAVKQKTLPAGPVRLPVGCNIYVAKTSAGCAGSCGEIPIHGYLGPGRREESQARNDLQRPQSASWHVPKVPRYLAIIIQSNQFRNSDSNLGLGFQGLSASK